MNVLYLNNLFLKMNTNMSLANVLNADPVTYVCVRPVKMTADFSLVRISKSINVYSANYKIL